MPSRTIPFRPFVVVALALCASILCGCVMIHQKPERTLYPKLVDNAGHSIDHFVLVRLTQSESVHGVEDPPKEDHWLPERITHIVPIDQKQDCFCEPRTTRLSGIVFAPFIGLGSQTRILYRVYAMGYEVWREPWMESGGVEWHQLSPSVDEVTFEVIRSRNRLQDLNSANPDSYFSPDYNLIVIDLLDDNFWSQIKDRYEHNQDRSAIQYICSYYLDRIKKIREVNPGWDQPEALKALLAWMESIV